MTPLFVPRLNANDDVVEVVKVMARVGAAVRAGEPVAEVATDKAIAVVAADRDGYIVDVPSAGSAALDVGEVLAWIGTTRDELPAAAAAPDRRRGPTLKARMLRAEAAATAANAAAPFSTGTPVALRPHERGMLRTVQWHHAHAVPGYVEIAYDPGPWQRFADRFQQQHELLLDPTLALLAWTLARECGERPTVNATLHEGHRHVYNEVNLGFAVYTDRGVSLVVVHHANRMDALSFCHCVTDLQRRALAGALRPSDVEGATVAFSSMARWPVTRHIPVLPPYTSLIVAHTRPAPDAATLGASFDHRVLSGGDAAAMLTDVARPPD